MLQYIAINPFYELQRDEFLHLDQGKHLAWGYLSVPPVSAWFSYIILKLGNTIFWVKFFPALFGVITLITVWHTVKALKGNLFACCLAATAITFSVIVRINTLFQPNSFEIMSWTILFYCIIRYLKDEENKWLIFAGIACGIAFLNKYNIVFVIIALIPALLISGKAKVLTNRSLYLGCLFAFIIMSPNLYWQYQHHFVVFHHLSTLQKTQLVNVKRLDFIKEQVLFFIPALFILIAAFLSFFLYEPLKRYKAIFWAYVFTITLFTYLRAKGYYALGLYPILFAFGSVYLESIFQKKGVKIFRPLSIAVILLIFGLSIKLLLPLLSPQQIIAKPKLFKSLGLLRWEDGKQHQLPQDFADMTGWKELANIVDSCYALQNNKENIAVLCDNYGQAGSINYYSKYKNINAITQNADYIDWYKLNKPITSVISIKDSDDPDSMRVNEKAYFENIQYIGKINNQFSRERFTNVYLMDKPKLSINDILKKEIANTKKEDAE